MCGGQYFPSEKKIPLYFQRKQRIPTTGSFQRENNFICSHDQLGEACERGRCLREAGRGSEQSVEKTVAFAVAV